MLTVDLAVASVSGFGVTAWYNRKGLHRVPVPSEVGKGYRGVRCGEASRGAEVVRTAWCSARSLLSGRRRRALRGRVLPCMPHW